MNIRSASPMVGCQQAMLGYQSMLSYPGQILLTFAEEKEQAPRYGERTGAFWAFWPD